MGFIGIDRGLRDHWVYQDAEYLKVWMEMLFLARFSEEPHTELIDSDIIKVEYGQFIFGRIKWSQRLKIGEQRLRTLITKLKKEKMIELVLEHRKCSVYALVNYAKFNHESNHQSSLTQQGIEGDANHQTNQQPTISQPSPNHQSTTKEQSKQRNNVNKVKKEVIKTLYGEHVLLSEEQYKKLINDLTEPDVTKLIDDINYWFTQKPLRIKDYKDHNLMIRKWHKNNLDKKLTLVKGGQEIGRIETRDAGNASTVKPGSLTARFAHGS